MAALAAACGDAPTDVTGGAAPLRTILVHQQTSGENVLINSDGTDGGTFGAATRHMLPLGAHAGQGVVALLNEDAIVLTQRTRTNIVDTIIDPAPTSHSLVSFSRSGDQLALVSYEPTAAVLVYDRASHRLDTLSLGGADPALPPVFSPEGDRLALITVNELSILVTILFPDNPGHFFTDQLHVSRVLNRPLFGWPQWGAQGLRMAFRRVAQQGPDTLLVGLVQPEDPNAQLVELYRGVMAPVSDQRPELDFGDASTYALSTDGSAVVLAAVPSPGSSTQAVYVVTSNIPRVQLLLEEPGTFPVFPLFIRE